MTKIYLRVISFTCDTDCFQRIKEAFLTACSDAPISNVNFSDLKPYWKIDGCGEMDISFTCCYEAVESIKTCLSANWENNVTDNRWATLFCNDIMFISLSA